MPTTLEDVRRLALALPEVVERGAHGKVGWRVGDRLFACEGKQPGVLVVWCPSVPHRDELIRAAPDRFFTEPHYDGHASVLVRSPVIDPDEVAELLHEAWEVRAPKSLLKNHQGGPRAARPPQ